MCVVSRPKSARVFPTETDFFVSFLPSATTDDSTRSETSESALASEEKPASHRRGSGAYCLAIW